MIWFCCGSAGCLQRSCLGAAAFPFVHADKETGLCRKGWKRPMGGDAGRPGGIAAAHHRWHFFFSP